MDSVSINNDNMRPLYYNFVESASLCEPCYYKYRWHETSKLPLFSTHVRYFVESAPLQGPWYYKYQWWEFSFLKISMIKVLYTDPYTDRTSMEPITPLWSPQLLRHHHNLQIYATCMRVLWTLVCFLLVFYLTRKTTNSWLCY